MTGENPYEMPASQPPRPSRWRRGLGWLAVAVVVGLVIVGLLAGGRRCAREAGRRIACSQNMQRIGKALHAYHDEHGALPPACLRDAEGKPLHGWRTLLLPYLGEQDLFATIDLSKPWDDPANAAARKRMPICFQCPSAHAEMGQTVYLAVVSPQGCFRADGQVRLDEVTMPSRTLLVAEFPWPRAVHWMAPEDADEELFARLEPAAEKSGQHVNGILTMLFADGHTESWHENHFAAIDAAARRAFVSVSAEKPAIDS